MSGNPAYVTVSLCDCPRGNFMSPSTKQTLPYFILEDVCGRWGAYSTSGTEETRVFLSCCLIGRLRR